MSTDTQDLARQIAEYLKPLLERDERPLLSVPQAAARLNISNKGAWNLVQRGELQTVIIGEGRRMVEPAAVDAYIASRRELTSAPDSG